MHLLVDNPLEVPHLLLHAVRQGGVVEAQAEFDVALLGAAGEVRAAHQQEAVVDAEELGVTRHRAPPVLERAGAHDDGAAPLEGPVGGLSVHVRRTETPGRRWRRSTSTTHKAEVG